MVGRRGSLEVRYPYGVVDKGMVPFCFCTVSIKLFCLDTRLSIPTFFRIECFGRTNEHPDAGIGKLAPGCWVEQTSTGCCLAMSYKELPYTGSAVLFRTVFFRPSSYGWGFLHRSAPLAPFWATQQHCWVTTPEFLLLQMT
jgi:hypothetical protein